MNESNYDLALEVTKKSGICIVTCGNCGRAMLHRSGATEIDCESCNYVSEPCDFPDLFY